MLTERGRRASASVCDVVLQCSGDLVILWARGPVLR